MLKVLFFESGASEGLCAASAILHYPNMCRSSPVQRNSSLPEGSQGHTRYIKFTSKSLSIRVQKIILEIMVIVCTR